MKGKRMFKAASFLAMAVILLLSAAACSTTDIREDSNASDTGSKARVPEMTSPGEKVLSQKRLVKLVIGAQEGLAAPDPRDASYKQDIMLEFEKVTGIELDFRIFSTDQLKLALAGGDLPDLLMVYSTFCKQLLEGNKVIAIDPYLEEHGRNITSVSDTRIALMKKNYSKDDNKLYFLPSWTDSRNGIANINLAFFPPTGYQLRWDVYKAIGCPTFRNDEEFIQVLLKMRENYPATPDGKPTYAYGLHNTFGVFMYHIRNELINGTYHWTWPLPYIATVDTNEIVNNFGDLNSPLWTDIQFYNKLNKLGLLDPDSFTMKYEDTNARSKAFQYLASPGHGGPANPGASDPDHPLAYYVNIPVEGTFTGINAKNEVGWMDRVIAVTRECKVPERAVDLIDAFNTPEIIRLLSNGIQGLHWDYTDGRPQIKPEYIEMKRLAAFDAAISEKYRKIGFEWGSACLWGLSGASYHPDGEIVDLWKTPDVYKKGMLPYEKDFAAYYNVSYPMEIFEEMIKEGRMLDYSGQDNNIPGALQLQTDEIKRIDTDIDGIMSRYIPRLVLSRTDEEFSRAREEVLDKLKGANMDKSWQWWKNNWDTARSNLQELYKQ